MSVNLKVIKQKAFEVDSTPQVHFTCAYKGRVFGVSTLRFPSEDIKLSDDKKVLTLPQEIEVLKHTSTDPITGEVRSYLDLVPKLDVVLAVI